MKILDVCCGSRMFYYDKESPLVTYMDIREGEVELSDGRKITIKPDIVGDFRAIPFYNETYDMVVFDPPHLLRAGKSSWLAKKYGVLNKDTWESDLRVGFFECFRVLKKGGVLIFKWSTDQIPLKQVLELAIRHPLFGDKRGKTHWIIFVKG